MSARRQGELRANGDAVVADVEVEAGSPAEVPDFLGARRMI